MLYALLLFAAEEKPQEGAPAWSPLVLMLLMFAAFYFLLILPARKRERREREALFSSLKKNDEVVTSAGIIGTVANIKDDEVTLKVDESSNVRMRVLKSSIVRILSPREAGKDAGSDSIRAGSPPAK
jgi:preprotein translocase subunit YajC